MPIALPEYFLRAALDLFIRNYSRFEILLGLHIVDGRYGVGLSGSFEQSILTRSYNLALLGVHIARFLRPVDAQQAQREP